MIYCVRVCAKYVCVEPKVDAFAGWIFAEYASQYSFFRPSERKCTEDQQKHTHNYPHRNSNEIITSLKPTDYKTPTI